MKFLDRLLNRTPKRELYPHEIFPQIIDWEKGDYLCGLVLGHYHWEFVGLLNNEIYIKERNSEATYNIPISRGIELENRDYIQREGIRKQEFVSSKIEQDQYNQFLQIVRETRDKTFEEWLPKQLKTND